METFSGRAGLYKGITPNNRTGVKVNGTGVPSRRNEEGGLANPSEQFLAVLGLEYVPFFIYNMTKAL